MANDDVSESTVSGDDDARVLAMRDAGASWLEIQRALGLTRQQARYAYQRARREERRARRKQK